VCLDEIINYLEGCHEKSYIGQVTDEVINFACTDPEVDDGIDTSNLGGKEGTMLGVSINIYKTWM